MQIPLENVHVASPCKANWKDMTGDDRKRLCGSCRLQVYNLSGMTRAEAEHLILTKEGRFCVRFYRRADGTVLTQDCPVGLAALRRRARVMCAATASLIAALLAGLGYKMTQPKPRGTVMGLMVSLEQKR
jgi:hypothetical protein